MKLAFDSYLSFIGIVAVTNTIISVAQCHGFDSLKGASSFTHNFFCTISENINRIN